MAAIKLEKNGWSIVYDRAIREDGTLFFPKRLTWEWLAEKRKELGPYIFSNQMLNEIVPAGDQEFKKDWIKYYDHIPDNVYTFAFVDPAISLEDTADFTAVVVVSIDTENNWYVRVAKRFKINATDTIELIYKVFEKFKPRMMGIETVAYQQSLMDFMNQTMRKRGYIPVHGVKRGNDKSKADRIRGLIPRFEWGSIFLARGLTDLEDELSKFPRSAHDDLLDALESINAIAVTPHKVIRSSQNVPSPSDAEAYERYYRTQKVKNRTEAD